MEISRSPWSGLKMSCGCSTWSALHLKGKSVPRLNALDRLFPGWAESRARARHLALLCRPWQACRARRQACHRPADPLCRWTVFLGPFQVGVVPPCSRRSTRRATCHLSSTGRAGREVRQSRREAPRVRRLLKCCEAALATGPAALSITIAEGRQPSPYERDAAGQVCVRSISAAGGPLEPRADSGAPPAQPCRYWKDGRWRDACSV